MNPRIHRPSARSYVSSYSSTPTITQSTALWKAMRHREEIESRKQGGGVNSPKTGGLLLMAGRLFAALSPFGRK